MVSMSYLKVVCGDFEPEEADEMILSRFESVANVRCIWCRQEHAPGMDLFSKL